MTHQSRKEKIRAYEEAPKHMSVHRVLNSRNGKSLLGAARDLRARMNRQLAVLKLKSHSTAALLHDWQTCGADAFEFEVLDTLEPPQDRGYGPTEDLDVLEGLWRGKLQPFGY
jgi:hypothetical protein